MREPRRTLVSVIAVCVAATMCAAGAAESRSQLTGGGKLVLVGVNLDFEDAAQAGLYVMNADGSGRRQITHNAMDGAPRWSPDGHSVAFLRENGLSARLMVIRADSTKPRSLGSALNLAGSSPWSRDGKQLAWDGCGGLCIYDLRSSRRTPISLGRDDAWGVAWSPDGRELAATDASDHLVVVNLAGRILRVLSTAGVYPTWSPDGKQIAFLAGHGNDAYKLEVVPAVGGRPRLIAKNALSTAPSWSPDGRRLLYAEFILRPFSSSVRVVNLATHKNTLIDASGGIARWSPDGAEIAYGHGDARGGWGQDIWIAQPDGSGRRQLTQEFPTGVTYNDLDWTSGSVPTGSPAPPPQLLSLTATAELAPGFLDGPIGRAGRPDSVVYRKDISCGDPDAEIFAATLNVWTPSSASTATSTAACLDFGADDYAVTPTLDAWIEQNGLDGTYTLSVMRPGTTEAKPIASWMSGQNDAPDIGWRASISNLVSDGSNLFFQTPGVVWRIADGGVVHAIRTPLPADATNLVDADNGLILIEATNGFAVLDRDGAVLSRVPSPTRAWARLGGGLLAVVADTTLHIYGAASGTPLHDLPLAHASGVPRLLTLAASYAVYVSGIELHLLRFADGTDQIINLPGETGEPQALLTSDGLFIAYDNGYGANSTRILFVPSANLP